MIDENQFVLEQKSEIYVINTNMESFKHYIESQQNPRMGLSTSGGNVSGLMNQDFSSMNLQQRMSQGRDIGEEFIRNQLSQHGIKITPAKGYHQDARLKIDGFWNGEPVQIKLRRSTRDDRNDIAYEVVRNHDQRQLLADQLKNEHQQGRDWKGQVQHYFVLNRDETEIYHISAKVLKTAVQQTIKEMTQSKMNGYLVKPFKSSIGVDLRPTRDPDPKSFTPFKVMAFIPVDVVVDQKFAVKQEV